MKNLYLVVLSLPNHNILYLSMVPTLSVNRRLEGGVAAGIVVVEPVLGRELLAEFALASNFGFLWPILYQIPTPPVKRKVQTPSRP